MTITLVDDYLLIESEAISEVIATPSDYLKLEVSGNINCCTSNCAEQVTTVTFDNPFTTTTKLELTGTGLKVFPAFFGLTSFIDGIYRFEIKRYPDPLTGVSDTLYEQNCIFVDVTFKCKVASQLKYIIAENKNKGDTEKVATIIHLLHYALVNGSNCGCNCAEMCEVFKELNTILNTINPQISSDCGC